MQLPKKYPRTLHWPSSGSVQKDDAIISNPETFLNTPVIITEKLDGGNTCLYKGEVYARSTGAPSHAGWMAMVRKHHGWKTTMHDVQFYGEDLYGIHSIEYASMKENETYRLFATRFTCDLLGNDNDTFHAWETVEWFAKELDVSTVPVLYSGTFKTVNEITEWFETRIKNESKLGGNCEGFVMRKADMFPAEDFQSNVVKYVRPNHVQTNAHWTRNWKPCEIIR